jgi:hypothetical protein
MRGFFSLLTLLVLLSGCDGCDFPPPPYEKIDWDFDGRTDATLVWKGSELDSMVIKEPAVTIRYKFIEKTTIRGKKVRKYIQLDDKPAQRTYVYAAKPFVHFSQTFVKGEGGPSWGIYQYNVLENTEYDRNNDGRADYILYFHKLRRERALVDDDYNGDFEKELKRGVDF